jgi:hypothetical protein
MDVDPNPGEADASEALVESNAHIKPAVVSKILKGADGKLKIKLTGATGANKSFKQVVVGSPKRQRSPSPSPAQRAVADAVNDTLAAALDRDITGDTTNVFLEIIKDLQAQLKTKTLQLEDIQQQLKKFQEQLQVAQTTNEELSQAHTRVEGKRQFHGSLDPKHLAAVAGKPQYFDGMITGGKSSINVRDWLMSVEMYLDLMADVIPVDNHVKTAATYLKGEALRYWHFKKQFLQEQEQQNWTAFKNALVERFDTANDPVSARYKLDKLSQGNTAMRKHVQDFDQLCSYIPDMTDPEKIHRFLTSVRPDCANILCNDPSTGARWTRYVDLRRYALNHYANERSSGAGGAPGHIKEALNALLPRKKQKTGSQYNSPDGRGRSREPKGGRGQGGSGDAGPSGVAQEDTYDYTDKEGNKVARVVRIKNYCFRKGLCGICYQPGHRASSCHISKLVHGKPKSMP